MCDWKVILITAASSSFGNLAVQALAWGGRWWGSERTPTLEAP